MVVSYASIAPFHSLRGEWLNLKSISMSLASVMAWLDGRRIFLDFSHFCYSGMYLYIDIFIPRMLLLEPQHFSRLSITQGRFELS